jgi:hypothetical protein
MQKKISRKADYASFIQQSAPWEEGFVGQGRKGAKERRI